MDKVTRILFLEASSDKVNLWLNVFSVNELPYSYSLVSDKEEFRERLISGIFNIIISDYILPGFDIREAIMIRNEISPHIPYIVIADLSDEKAAARCVRHGSDDFVVKSHLSRLPFAVINSLNKQNAITFRLNAEEELRTRRDKDIFFEKILNNFSVAVMAVDGDNRIKVWNRSLEELLGWNHREVIGLPAKNFFKEEYFDNDQEQITDSLNKKGFWMGEISVKKKNDQKVRLLCKLSGLNRNHAEQVETLYELQEISLRNKPADNGHSEKISCNSDVQSFTIKDNISAEPQQIKIKGCLDLIVKSMKIGMFSMDFTDNTFSYDNRSCQILNLDPKNYFGTGEELLQKIHKDDRDETNSLLRYSINRKKDYETEFRVIWSDGSLHYLVVMGKIIYDENMTPVRLNGLLWETTDQKLLEIHLRENLRKINSIINNLNGAIFRSYPDENMTMEYISEGIKAISGYNSTDFLLNKVRSLYSIMVPKDKETVKKEISSALSNGCPYTVEYRIKSSNGTVKWIWMKGHGVFSGKSLIAHEGSILDISDRKKAEFRLNRSLKQLQQLNRYMQTVREKERLAISRELHDDLGQSLTAVKIDLGTLKHKLDNKEEALNRIEKTSTLVTETIKTVQNITAHLRPQIIDDLGLESAIEWYSKDFSDRTNIMIDLRLEPIIEMPSDLSLTIFRIVQESLTNIARHSKATRAEIRLLVHEKNLLLNIKDNGSGISDQAKKSKKSFGLISMMDRARSHDGDLKIYTHDEGGTKVSLKIPLKPEL